MDAREIIKPEFLFLQTDIASKREALEFISQQAVRLGISNDANVLQAALWKRESEMATGLVGGFAIPHAKSDAVARPAILFAVAPCDIDWGSYDGGSIVVNRIFALLVPRGGGEAVHLRLLSQLAVCLINESFCEEVRREGDADRLCALLRGHMNAHENEVNG